jgi:hypothetical protein
MIRMYVLGGRCVLTLFGCEGETARCGVLERLVIVREVETACEFVSLETR